MIFSEFDTNVLIASLLSKLPDSATVQVVDAIADNKIILLYNYDILVEYEEVLHREKFRFREERSKQTLAVIQEYGVSISTLTPTGETLPDEDNLVFYELVMEKRDDAYLITGNIKYFQQRRFIVTHVEMMEILRQMEQKQ